MSNFKVEVTRVLAVEDHPNADRLSLVTVMGYLAISDKPDGKPRYAAGDLVVYISEAALLPEGILRKMGFWDAEKGKGSLAGGNGNRVKAMRLRGIFSLGLLYPVVDGAIEIPVFTNDVGDLGSSYYLTVAEGDDVGSELGIEKWNPPVPVHMAGEVCNISGHPMKYDFDNFESAIDIFDGVVEVVATEKLHGTFCAIGLVPGLNHGELFGNGDIFVGSKGMSAQGLVFKDNPANDGNLYVKALRALLDNGFADRLRTLSAQHGNAPVHVFAEILGKGVQDLAYGFDKPVLRAFDIAVGREFLSYDKFMTVAVALGLETVPEVYLGPFDVDALRRHRDGKTTYGGVNIREGIVVRSTTEMRHPYHGRTIAKLVSPDYRLRKNKDATEYV